jgi:hypothetical protein
MNTRNIILSAIVFSSVFTNFNVNAQNDPHTGSLMLGAAVFLAIGTILGHQFSRPTEKQVNELKNQIVAEQEKLTVVGNGVIIVSDSFGNVLDKLEKAQDVSSDENQNIKKRSLLIADNKGRNAVKCNGFVITDSRDFHLCPEYEKAFVLVNKQTTQTFTVDNKQK